MSEPTIKFINNFYAGVARFLLCNERVWCYNESMKSPAVPKKLQPILWSTDVKLLDVQRDKGYIINQVLIYGTLDETKWLFDTYSKREVVRVFLTKPSKQYPKEVYYFIKNFILSLKDNTLDEQDYVTSISGPTRPRAAKSI